MDSVRARATPSPRAADDVTARPWTYPGTPAPHSGRLLDGRFHALTADDVRRLAVRRRETTTAVVAVGCNASPTVLSRKLRERGASDDVLVVTALLRGFAVGHSAHISAPGYLAATPYVDPDAQSRVVVLLLDATQLDFLDETEPNYHRRTIADGTALALSHSDRSDRFDRFAVYDSMWGVLAPPGQPPVPLSGQRELHRYLRACCPPYADAVPASDDLAETMARLSADAGIRRRVRAQLRATGWARPSGLEPAPVRSC